MSTAPRTTLFEGVFDPRSLLALRMVEVDHEPAAVILRPINTALGQRECPAILEAAAEVLETIDKRVRYLVLDLANVTTFSALGLGLCQDIAKRAAARRLKPVLAGLNAQLLDQLRLFKVDQLFTIVHTRGELVILTGS